MFFGVGFRQDTDVEPLDAADRAIYLIDAFTDMGSSHGRFSPTADLHSLCGLTNRGTMELQLGITGIQGRKGPGPEPPLTDLKAFHSHCHYAARVLGANVQSIRDPFEEGIPSNHAIARIQFSDTVVAVLVNSIRPIIAFAKCTAEGQITVGYIDCPKLADAFLDVGEYTIPTSDELNRPLLREMCKNLAPAEQKRVRYFRPARVGDVIYNYWD